jgi:hypothetical protein
MTKIEVEDGHSQLPQCVNPPPEGSIVLNPQNLSQDPDLVVIGTKSFNYLNMVRKTNAEAEVAARRGKPPENDPIAKILLERQQAVSRL